MRNIFVHQVWKLLVWDNLLAQFEAHLKQSGLAQNTVKLYLRDLRSFSLWLSEYAGQEVSPATFSSKDVEAYKQHLRDALGRSPASINRSLQSLRKFGRFALMARVRDTNPVQDVRLLEGSAPLIPRTLTELEIDQLVKAAEASRSRTAVRNVAILQLLLQTGIRAGELINLQLADIDLSEDHGTLTVRGQGKRPARRIPLNQAARDALRAYLDQPRPTGASHLFLGREGKPLSIRSVQQIVDSLGKAAELEISVKTLRNTYARLLWQETRDLGLLTERMGYRKVETALKHIVTPAHGGIDEGGSEGRSLSIIG
ncbi:MAG: tyrosine-type recombinase/integrase [Anaerolineae bacterium]